MKKVIVSICFSSIFYAVSGSRLEAKIKATDAVSGGTLLIFASEKSPVGDDRSEGISAVFCPFSAEVDQDLRGCAGKGVEVFRGISDQQLRNLMSILLPEVEANLEESDIKVHVHGLNLWAKKNRFVALEQQRRDLEDKLMRMNRSLEELKSSGLSSEKIKETVLFKQADELSKELKIIRDRMLPIEPSREAIAHEFDVILKAAQDQDVHLMVALSPSVCLVEVILSIFSQREDIENIASTWSGFVIDLERVELLKGHRYVISSEPGKEIVNFFKCQPEEDPSGCMTPNGVPGIRMNKESFIRSAEATVPIHRIISQASWKNQYKANVIPDEALELLKIINLSVDRDKEWEGVDLPIGRRWWRAYADCTRLKAAEISEQYPDWNLPDPEDLTASLDFFTHSGWMSQEPKIIDRLWIKAEPSLSVGRVRDRFTRARETGNKVDFYDFSMTIPWQMNSPYAELTSEVKTRVFATEVNATSTTQKDYVYEGAQLRHKIASSNWRTFSAQKDIAAAWLWNEY